MVKIGRALIVASVPSGKRQTLATSKTTTPSSSCHVDQRARGDSTFASSVVVCASTTSRPVTVGAFGERQADVVGVVGADAFAVLCLHGGEVVSQQVEGGLVDAGHGSFLAGDEELVWS